MKESQYITKAVRNADKVLIINIIAVNKISGKLKERGLKSCNTRSQNIN